VALNVETWMRDLRHAARSLSRAPMFAAVTVLTLALSIGASTTIFSVVQAVLLEPLPFPDADRLVHISGTAPGTDLADDLGVPDELYFAYQKDVPAIEDLGIYGTGSSTTRVDDQIEQLFLARATASFFSTLGAQPVLGRLPTAEDDDKVIVISHWLWESWFGSDPAVLGRSHEFASQTRTVIGVMGPEFRFPSEEVAFWVNWPLREAQVTPGGFGANVVARVANGTDQETLVTQLSPLARQVQERLGGSPQYARIMQNHRPTVTGLREHLVGEVASPLWILMGAVTVVFLIACANVANLFAVRAESRRQDLAVRRALGAGRGGLVRTQMAEALLLAGAGGVAGALLAWVGVPLLVRAAPDAVSGGFGSAPIPGLATAGLSLSALLFALGISLLAALAFGLAPALRMSGAGLLASLRQAGRGSTQRRSVVRDVLVVTQTALALVLLVGSALLVRSFQQLRQVDAGYDTKDIFSFQVSPGRSDLTDRASISRFQYEFMDRLRAIPGVESVGFVNTLPLDEGAGSEFITTRNIVASGAEAPTVRVTGAGGQYFQTMGIELRAGRHFERVEEERGLPFVIISSAAAEQLFPGEDPLGQQLRPAGGNPDNWYSVIGVVEDVLIDDLRRSTPEPTVYLPAVSQSPAYVVRSARADQLTPEIRAVIKEMMPRSPMYRIFTMETLAANAMARLSFTMLLLVMAAALALVLAAVGLYGVLSYQVSQRTHEIGVRMALGAEAGKVRRMFVAQGGKVTLIGVVIGLAAAAGLTRFLATLLFGVQAMDLLTFGVMAALMLGVAVLASYLPARRASSVDPATAMRAE
jgi:putative ABC transport system permease protein